jgi:hypothetical protein
MLLRNFEIRDPAHFGQPLEIRFSEFTIKKIQQNGSDLDEARQIFPQANFGDCIYRRDYAEIPQPLLAYGYGRIPFDAEDALMSLRLYRSGDIAFVQLKIQKQDGSLVVQDPYRATSDVVSSQVYEFRQDDVPNLEAFATELTNMPGWESAWFKIARRFFLYGGAKEFNVTWEEVDRLVDYMIALEAALVPEHLFVGRCLRERAVRLIDQDDQPTKRFLRDLYNIRSTIAHGSPLSERDKEFLNGNRFRIEEVVRQILVAALRLIPGPEADRTAFLNNLYVPSDADYVELADQQFAGIVDPGTREQFLIDLVAQQRFSRIRLARFLARCFREAK